MAGDILAAELEQKSRWLWLKQFLSLLLLLVPRFNARPQDVTGSFAQN
jgi:hypothetical protein